MRITISFFLAAIVLVGCQLPISQNAGTTSSIDLTKPGLVIKSLELGTIVLPKSLQENTGSSEARSTSRAMGDVTSLTSLNLPSLKGSGYNSFKQSVGSDSIVKIFLDSLKAVPAIADGSLSLNSIIDTGEIFLKIPYLGTIALPNSGRLRTSLTDEGQTLLIYWSLLYPDQAASPPEGGYSDPQDMFNRAPRVELNLYFVVKKSGDAELYAYRKDDGKGHFMNYWTKVDSETGEKVEAQESNWGSETSSWVSVVLSSSDGGNTIYRSSDIPENNYHYETMGYANDAFGGVVSSGSSSYDSNGDGVPEDNPYLNVEYYDGTGDLVYQGWGNSGKNTSEWSWRFNQAASINLYELNGGVKPGDFKTRAIWSSGNWNSSISFNDGQTWNSYTPNGTFVYHDPSEDNGTWNIQPGDALYWSSNWTNINENGTWIYETTYYRGYEVPAGETYFGQTYFVNKTFPLKNLLPLKAQYAVGFEVKQKEGDSHYYWTGLDGTYGYGTAEPSSGTYKPNSLYSWTNYSYWLENKNYLNNAGINDNEGTALDIDKGDISLQLNNMTVYTWNSELGKSVQQEAPAFSTYTSELPPYFGLDQTKLDAVAETKAKLEAFYTQRTQYTAASYLTGYLAKMTPVLPLFPSLEGYPGAP